MSEVINANALVQEELRDFIKAPRAGTGIYILDDNPLPVGGGNIAATQKELAVGTVMTDGSIFAGISPDTGREMYLTAQDAPLTYTFNDAADFAKSLTAHNQNDWRVPTKNELKVIFDNRAAISGFMVSDKPAWYWSSTQETSFSAWAQRFTDGHQVQRGENMASLLRCVRS